MYNFSEFHEIVNIEHLRQVATGTHYTDLIQGRSFDLNKSTIELSPYEVIWCKKD